MKKLLSSCKGLLCLLVLLLQGFNQTNAQTVLADVTPANYDVSATGAFNYTVPLRIPPGIKDMMPQLAVSYSSQSGNSIMGMGWSLAGLSAITRTSHTIYHNNEIAPPLFNGYDNFVLDGQRLFLDVPSTTTYLTEVKNFSKIEAHGTIGNGPSYFTVENTMGIVAHYGNTIDSKMMAAASGVSDVLTWYINRIEDKNGNYIDFLYDYSTGFCRISKISYTGNDTPTPQVDPSTEIDFHYESRDDKNKTWVTGAPVIDDTRLADIEVVQNSIVVNKYEFDYDETGLYSRLKTIDEIRDNGNYKLPTITINWNTITQDDEDQISLNLIASYNGNNPFQLGDYNGDGATDIIDFPPYIVTNGPYNVYLNKKDGTFTAPLSQQWYYNGSSGDVSGIKLNTNKFFMDYDGDGDEDLVVFIKENVNGVDFLTIQLMISDGVGGFTDAGNILVYSTTAQHTTGWIGYITILPGDFDGDGKKELLVALPSSMSGSSVNFYTVNIIGFNYPTNNGALQGINYAGSIANPTYAAYALDYDGDGRDDFFRTVDNQTNSTEIYILEVDYVANPGYGNSHYDPAPQLRNSGNSLGMRYSGNFPTTDHNSWTGDFNGDGKMDFLTWKPWNNPQHEGEWEIAYAKGIWGQSNNNGYDHMTPGGDLGTALANMASGPYYSSAPPLGPGHYYSYYINDFNGDGKDDIAVFYQPPPWLGGGSSYYDIFYSRGYNDFVHQASRPWGHSIKYDCIMMGDFNGDGQADALVRQSNNSMPLTIHYFNKDDKSNLVSSIENGGNTVHIDISSIAQGDFYNPEDTLYHDGLGYGDIDPSIKAAATDNNYPFYSRTIPMKVVTEIEDDFNIHKSYEYGNLMINSIGLGIRGFRYVWSTDIVADKFTEQLFNPVDYVTSVPIYKAYCATDMVNLDITRPWRNHKIIMLNHYTGISYYNFDGGANGLSRIIKSPYSYEKDYGSGTYIETSMEYPLIMTSFFKDYGLPNAQIERSFDNVNYNPGPGSFYIGFHEYKKVEYTYDANAAFHNLSKPISVKTTLSYPNKPDYIRIKEMEYDATTGNLLTMTEDPSTPETKVTTYSQYDVFGNAWHSTLSAPNVPNVENSYAFSADGRFLTQTVNTLGYEDNYSYNNNDAIWGNITEHTTPDGLTTTFEYDALNRLTKATDPITGKHVETSYGDAANSQHNPGANGRYMSIKKTQGLQAEAITFYDYYNRKIRTATTAFGGQQTIYEDIVYNDKGLVDYSTAPYFAGNTPVKTTFVYNDMGMETSRAIDNGATYLTEYNVADPTFGYPPVPWNRAPGGITTTVTRTGSPTQTKVTTTDARGVPVKVEENIGTGQTNIITYDYNSNGQPDNIYINGSSSGNTVAYEYDDFGRVKKKTDNSSGETQYSYTEYGQLEEVQYAITTNKETYTYDDLGRTQTKTVTGANNYQRDYVYEYEDNPVVAIGKLNRVAVADNNGSSSETTYEYDNMGREWKIRETIDNQQPLITTTEYEQDYGRISTLEYPNNTGKIQYNYDPTYGFMESIDLVGGQNLPTPHRLWTINDMNAYGQVISSGYHNGNDFNISRGFDALGNITSSTIDYNNSVLADFGYNFDGITGNLESRYDYKYGLDENFTYDVYDRLTEIKQGGFTSLAMGYDPMGNITRKTDVGLPNFNWKTASLSGGGGYMLAQVNEPQVPIPQVDQDIEYYPFKKVKTITEDPYDAEFSYGPEDQRNMAIYNKYGTGAYSKKRYYASNFEKTIDQNNPGDIEELSYVFGGNELIAIIVHRQGNNAVDEVNYIFTDHLGSITQVMDINGSILDERSYDAWGMPRNPQTWAVYNTVSTTGPNVMPAFLFDRGYTGHEHLIQFNLINMNGRLYDPLVGRMLSPDPVMADETGSQYYNRYSYCNNNPLKFTDPDGHFFFVPMLIGAAIFGAGNLAAHAARGDVNNFGAGLKYFGQGALAGAVIGTGVGLGLSVPTLATAIKAAGVAQAGYTAASLVGGAIAYGMQGVSNASNIFLSNFYLDENKSFFGGVWEGISRHTYQAIQTNLGYYVAQYSNTIGKVNSVEFWGGATFSNANYDQGSITFGSNILLSNSSDETRQVAGNGGYTTMHEYGHYLQSQRNGFAYLFKYGITSSFKDRDWTELDANLRAARYFNKHYGFDWNPSYLGNSRYSRLPSDGRAKNTKWWEYPVFPLTFLWN